MSPNVGNFVHDLVEMAKAMETLPQVQAELDRANTQIETYARQVQDREISIIAYKQEIDNLQAKVRSLEVERDNASFRVLEAEDLNYDILNLARTAATNLAGITVRLDPPKLGPVKEPDPQGSSEANPTIHGTVASTSSQDQTSVNNTATQLENASTSITTPEAVYPPGQSESSPTANTHEVPENAMQSPAQSTDVGSTTMETSSAEPTHGPYFGKRYIDVSGWVAFDDWINGGGTYENYYAGRS